MRGSGEIVIYGDEWSVKYEGEDPEQELRLAIYDLITEWYSKRVKEIEEEIKSL